MIIDIHNHPDWHGHNCEKFIENMDRYHIDITCLLSWEAPADEWDPATTSVMTPANTGTPIPFARCLAYQEKYPDRFLLGYSPDPRKADSIDKLISAKHLYGVKLYGELKLRMMYDNRDAIRLYRACGKEELPVLVHLDYELPTGRSYPRPNYWYGGGIDALERAVAACPETVFIGHAPGFWAHLSGDGKYETEAYPTGKVLPGGKIPELLDRYPNLYCDLSAGSGCNALRRDPAFAKQFLTQYQGRILYGRDYFDNNHQEFIATLGLDQSVLDNIYFKNASKILHLT